MKDSISRIGQIQKEIRYSKSVSLLTSGFDGSTLGHYERNKNQAIEGAKEAVKKLILSDNDNLVLEGAIKEYQNNNNEKQKILKEFFETCENPLLVAQNFVVKINEESERKVTNVQSGIDELENGNI